MEIEQIGNSGYLIATENAVGDNWVTEWKVEDGKPVFLHISVNGENGFTHPESRIPKSHRQKIEELSKMI